jgi:anthranilate/para-aminobenzoate synthase component I
VEPVHATARTQRGAVCRRTWSFPTRRILSASPERFLRIDRAGRVETRPIKGTRPRGLGPEHDAALGHALTESEKDRAENLMIVDLMRNDLSRVCLPGTVRVPELFTLERYATVHHLVSTVVGQLAPGQDALDVVHAAFPLAVRSPAPRSCARWRSLPSSSRRSAACTAAQSAIGASPAISTRASRSAP